MPVKICANAPSPLVRRAVDPGIVPQAASLASLRWHACAAVCVSIVPAHWAPGGPARLCSCSSLMFAHGRKHLQDLLYLALSVVSVLVNAAYGVSYTYGDRLTRARTYALYSHDPRVYHGISRGWR